jgi:hypothetical protein
MEADPPAAATRLQNGPRKVSARAAPGSAGPGPGVSAVSPLCSAGTAATLAAGVAGAPTVTGQGVTNHEGTDRLSTPETKL